MEAFKQERPCAFCGNPVDVLAHRTYRKVIGWERHRDAGGTNALALRQPLEEFAHAECVDKAKSGLNSQQMVLA